MHQRKSKKILIYFFLLITVGSINNINLDNLKFYAIKDINIYGLNEYNNKLLIKNIKNLNLDSIFFLNRNKISKILEENTMIENYRIFKNYPSTLDIKIEKTTFLAKINHENKIYYIGTNGKLSYLNSLNKELPYIFGKPEINENHLFFPIFLFVHTLHSIKQYHCLLIEYFPGHSNQPTTCWKV